MSAHVLERVGLDGSGVHAQELIDEHFEISVVEPAPDFASVVARVHPQVEELPDFDCAGEHLVQHIPGVRNTEGRTCSPVARRAR